MAITYQNQFKATTSACRTKAEIKKSAQSIYTIAMKKTKMSA